MKVHKILSGFLFGLGCVVTFVGLAATVLPMIQNDQLRLVLSSFETPSQNAFVNAINHAMSFSLRNCYLVMVVGAGVVLAGALLMLTARPSGEETAAPAARAPYVAVPGGAEPPDMPVWRASRAPEAREANPFADTSLQELLAPRAAAGRIETAEERPSAAYAPPASQPNFESAYAPPARRAREPVAYMPPARPDEAASPYARPAGGVPAMADDFPNQSLPARAEELRPQEPPSEPAKPAPVPTAPTKSEAGAFPPGMTAAAPVPRPGPAFHPPLSAPVASPLPPAAPPDPHPFDPPAGGGSQSGGRIVIRSTFAARPAPDEPSSGRVEAAPASAPAAPDKPAPRIKSTMGRHGG